MSDDKLSMASMPYAQYLRMSHNEDNYCNCPFYNPKPMPLDGSGQVIYCKTCGKLILIDRVKGLPTINEYMNNH